MMAHCCFLFPSCPFLSLGQAFRVLMRCCCCFSSQTRGTPKKAIETQTPHGGSVGCLHYVYIGTMLTITKYFHLNEKYQYEVTVLGL